MRIHEIDTGNHRDVDRFIQVPFDLYQGSRLWVPPMISDARLQLDRQRNPYFQNNDAAFFIAEQNGRAVGRIAALQPAYYNAFKGLYNLHYYLFDCIDDQEAASGLFDAAAEWGRARGLKLFRGPLGFMAFDGFGMLARGFDHRPAVGIPYNHGYYPRLAETWGFELEERVYSGYFNVREMIANFPERILSIAEKVKERYGFTIKVFGSKKELREWVAPRLADLYNRTLTHIAGDPPITQGEIDTVADSMLQIAEPELLKFIVKGDDIVGFLFCFLDISEGIQTAKGRLFPLGFIPILWDLKRTNWINLNGMGISPEYQGFGGTALLYAELYHTIKHYPRFEHGDVVQISEFNAKSLNEMKKFGIDFYKTHHIYRKAL
jgi:hypothetical protein